MTCCRQPGIFSIMSNVIVGLYIFGLMHDETSGVATVKKSEQVTIKCEKDIIVSIE
jgi:hypothetical protein